MRVLREFVSRVRGIFGRDGAQQDIREELQTHVELATADNIRRGFTPNEARRRALAASGGLTQAAEAMRDQQGLPWVEHVGIDIRYAVRSLRRSPVYAAVVVLTLALGMGANTAIFSVVRGVLLKPLPHRDGDRLLYLRHSADGPGRENLTFSVPEVRDLRQGVPSLSGIAEYSSWEATLDTRESPVRVDVGLVTGNYFEVMGLSTILGRVTRPSDDGPSADRVAILTYETWLTRFGGDSSVVGRTISLNRREVTVIGVLQPAPFFPAKVEMLGNMVNSNHHVSASMENGRTHRMTEVVARLAPGATVDAARVEVEQVYRRLKGDFREAYDSAAHFRVAVVPFQEAMGARARLTLWLLMASAVFVLIVSAANVTNLTLMRGVRRESELVLRTALGAARTRLRRLLLVENMILTLAASALGVFIALGVLGSLVTFAQRVTTRANEIRLDGTVFAFTVGVSFVVALLLSYLASLPREGNIASRILAGTQRMSGGLKRQRMQRALVVLQVAVSVVLLAGAGLLTRTVIALSNIDTGLATENVLTMQVSLFAPSEMFNRNTVQQAVQRVDQMRDELARLPGVRAVGMGGALPLRNLPFFQLVEAEGKPVPAGEAAPRARLRSANPDFFKAAGIPILKGRAFQSTDDVRSDEIAVVNQTLVDRFYPNEDPIGRRVGLRADWFADTTRWRTIVGVVGNTRDDGLEDESSAVVFVPMAGLMPGGAGFVIQGDGNAANLATAATRIVRGIAPNALIEQVMTIGQYKDLTISPRRLNAFLISSFGVLALVIAAIGIAGVLAFSVGARTSEIGIRMSLGADRGKVQRMVLGEGGALLGLGLSLGVAAAFYGVSFISSLLYGVHPHDPVTFAAVAALISACGVLACWIPALRASRIDPAIAMRA